MEVHSAPEAAKRMWGYLRAVFFMVRKGVLSKRRLLLSMQLVMRLKRRNRAVARSVANLLSHHHGGGGGVVRRREYEFSCSNSPDVVPGGAFSYGGGGGGGGIASRRRLAYFPCLGTEVEETQFDAGETTALRRIEYYAAAAASPAPSSPGLLLQEELAPGDECTPAHSPLLGTTGGYSVRVSNYSSEEEDGNYDRGVGAGCEAVDDEAEEFIRRFYEQLRSQNHLALLPYVPESAA
ncbi:hypothetical protein E2562_016666 [Oryza meyeriana var. granulata]|uniref:Uncharacterized protein n=1 Tax=Oryza meyeriana var. granulata TaxID=110450 RepID=A0A6G1EKW2_9ORYZ|nr:hypothetical protein E2562_016666 [Oryza meyeriana var. granulata]